MELENYTTTFTKDIKQETVKLQVTIGLIERSLIAMQTSMNTMQETIAAQQSTITSLKAIIASPPHISSTHGFGYVQVYCPAGYYVSSCGNQPDLNPSGYENFRQLVPFLTYCQCFDRYGTICFAFCSKYQ